ncbi:hypothetical protein [Tepidibacter formicigenes]|jgi:thioredoxin reductase|uniref:Uncharacterized protein n=1 Tax=Tepidibacter formicigenes DSM 15518 TaxID=1123349 RepID=A0A1M6NHT5_9FIRM|nr:hypothetical protein [Tepidibacter formicigenes]SHJ95275.1 hypothetical protein SAMN02744037_01267 [Tepidibacter formicigenes DSM 15518]
MKQIEKDHNVNTNKSENLGAENARRIDELIDVVEKHTRTERHLEQHSDIASPEQIEHAKKIQEDREDRMENLKNIIAYGKHSNDNELKNLEKNYHYTQGYLEHNQDHMNQEDVEKAVEKQEHRKDQMKFLK